MSKSTKITTQDGCMYTYWLPVSAQKAADLANLIGGCRGVETSWYGIEDDCSRVIAVVTTRYWQIHEVNVQLHIAEMNRTLADIWECLVNEEVVAESAMPEPISHTTLLKGEHL